MIIKGNNGKASARKRQPKSAPSSSKSKRSNSVPKNPVSRDNGKATDELEGNLVCTQGRALEGATGDQVLAETEADSGMSGAVVQQSELENVLKDAFGKEKSDRPSDDDCGEVQHLAEEDGQLNLLEFDSNEPPEPDDYPGNLEGFKAAYSAWESNLADTAEEEYQHVDAEEIWNQSSNGNGSICAQELGLDSPTPGLNVGDDRLTYSVSKTNIADESLTSDSPADQSPQTLSEVIGDSTMQQISLPQALPASPSAMTEIDSLPKTIETVSPQSLPPSINCNPNLQSSKTLPACSTAQNDQEAANFISLESLTNFPRAGTMQNGKLSAAPTLPPPGVESESLLLRSPLAVSWVEPVKSLLVNQ